MKVKVLATLLLTLLLITPTHAPAFNWAQIANKVTGSVARLVIINDNDGGVCTTFSIHSKKNFWLTAAHCLGKELYISGMPAWVLYYNKPMDLMVLGTVAPSHPSMYPSHNEMSRGTPMASEGYAFGYLIPLFKAGHTAYPAIPIDDSIGTYLVTDFPIIGGMSGGPMVDMDGKVVAINQLTNNAIALGRSIGDIMEATAQFWEHK